MQVGRIISAPVQKVGNAVSKMGKVTKAAALATAIGAAAVYGGTTNNVQQATTKAPATLKAVGGVGGFIANIYTDKAAMSNKSVRVENDKLDYVFHTTIPESHLKILGSKTLEAETRDFQEVGTITESKTSHTDPKYGPVYEYRVVYPKGYEFGWIQAKQVFDKENNGVAITNIPSFKK